MKLYLFDFEKGGEMDFDFVVARDQTDAKKEAYCSLANIYRVKIEEARKDFNVENIYEITEYGNYKIKVIRKVKK